MRRRDAASRRASALALAALLLGPLEGVAAGSESDAACADVGTTREIESCLARELDAADRELNRYYAEALRVLASPRDTPPEAGARDPVAALRAAQRSWVRFRDQECEAEYQAISPGTLAASQALGCKLALTRERTRQLWNGFLSGASTQLAAPR
ncbi:MAG TPA: lysozyme inhibitor LprI family protein [Myxococcota bacterium]|jgi:uncharacterized protein YecT (DUF1311 family)|nr:lysozyme inhibitor LprI family protein [Myxococcota bacterium]